MEERAANQTLAIRTTDRSDTDIFERFFAGYDRAFVLPDEKEDREGLEACLALNHGAAHASLAASFGPFRELCLVASGVDGAPVGGANFIAMPSAALGPSTVTANLNYIYVDGEARGRGNLRRLLEAVTENAAGLFEHGEGRPLIFIEQNDPFRMSEESYERDTRAAGIDQLDRLRIWARLGARVVDFPYVQPALSEEQGADDTLIYSVLGSPGPLLDPAILHGHLRRFFGISVLKGARLEADDAAVSQLNRLQEMMADGHSIALLDPAPLLDRFTSPGQAATLLGRPPRSFREELHLLTA
jgi:GNAT superfamily N-acetyltransferase